MKLRFVRSRRQFEAFLSNIFNTVGEIGVFKVDVVFKCFFSLCDQMNCVRIDVGAIHDAFGIELTSEAFCLKIKKTLILLIRFSQDGG